MRTLTLSNKHLRRAEILTRLVAGKLSTAEAAQLLGLTTRQVRRLRRRFTAEGVASLVHGNAGRAPINRTDPAIVERLRALCGEGQRPSVSRPPPHGGHPHGRRRH